MFFRDDAANHDYMFLYGVSDDASACRGCGSQRRGSELSSQRRGSELTCSRRRGSKLTCSQRRGSELTCQAQNVGSDACEGTIGERDGCG